MQKYFESPPITQPKTGEKHSRHFYPPLLTTLIMKLLLILVKLFIALIWSFASLIATIVLLPYIVYEIFLWIWNPKKLKRSFAL